jgi:pyruvate/2-oxoglutarate dehydrogenase complex dihydrolipoamide acyltransferase (E2) component
MATEVKLPQWGQGMTEGTVVEWVVDEGAEVSEGQQLAEIDAAKAQDFVLAPISGTLAKILVAADETVPCGTALAVIVEPGEEYEG